MCVQTYFVKPLNDRNALNAIWSIDARRHIEEPLEALSRSHTHKHTCCYCFDDGIMLGGKCTTLINAFINLNNNEPIFLFAPDQGRDWIYWRCKNYCAKRRGVEKYIHTR